MSNENTTPAIDAIADRIAIMRGQRVIVDADLAALYGVPTKRLNEQVRRNAERFLEDFMFQFAQEEWNALRSQIATLKTGSGYRWHPRCHSPAYGATSNTEETAHGLHYFAGQGVNTMK